MKRLLTKMYFPLVLMACLAAISSSGIPTQARSLEEIQQTKEIRICLVPKHPTVVMVEPADCHENCKYSGAAYEIAMTFVETLGNQVKPKFLRVEFDEQFFNKEGVVAREDSYTPELLASGQCDLYPNNLTKNSWRLKKLDFVILFPSRMMVLVHKSKKVGFKTPADLGGKGAAVVKDTSYHTWLQEQNKSTYATNPIQIKLMGFDESLEAVVSRLTIDHRPLTTVLRYL